MNNYIKKSLFGVRTKVMLEYNTNLIAAGIQGILIEHVG